MSAARNVRTGGLQFDGRTGYVQLPYFSVFNRRPFTVTCWLYYREWASYGALLACGDAKETDRYLRCAIASDRPTFGFYNDDLTAAMMLKRGERYHLAFVWEGQETRRQIIYVNGEEVASRTSTGLLTVTTGALTGYGCWVARVDSIYFGCIVSDLRIFEGALPRSKIVLIYQRGEPIYDGLEAWYPMHETSGDVVHDISGKNRHGTRIGGAYWMVKPSARQLAPARVLPKAR